MLNKLYVGIKNYIVNNYKFLISAIVIIFLFTFELPFVIYTPGSIVNLEERVEIDGAYDASGSFNMSSVSLMKGKIPFLLLSYIIPNWDIAPVSDVTSDRYTLDELIAIDRIYMSSSISNATILAYEKAGKEINITSNNNYVVNIVSDAETTLKVRDKIISVDGVFANDVSEIKEIINSKSEGDYINIKVLRDNKEVDTTSKIFKTDYGLKVGVVFLTTYNYEADPEIKVSTSSKESGSSGGLMLSLDIYNKLVEEDITKGKKIVGTGTISVDGTVGAIDGIKYKLLGAASNKADVFLCPSENYAEASKVKSDFNLDINLIEVHTFDEAIEKLKDI